MVHLQAAALKVVDHQQVQLGRADRFDVVRESTMLERRLPQLGIVDARDHDHGGVGPGRPQLLQQPITGLVGQPDVQQRHRVVLGFEQPPRLRAGEREVALKTAAAEDAGHHLREGLVVVHHEDSFSSHGHAV